MRSAAIHTPVVGDDADGAVLRAIEDRVLWLAVRMIHEANNVREHPDGLKVGGHQASSASVVSMFTALYARWLRPDDLIAIKPHASPVYHALQYLFGNLDRSYLPRLRALGGLQSYPSRTKDPDDVHFSTGSVGLGAVVPLFASLADRYLATHFAEQAEERPDRRFIATVGDAELDEGNVWEAVVENALRGTGNFTMIVDLNRQSLDRVIPGIRVREIEAGFAAGGWQVLEAKYGRRLQERFAAPGGGALRRAIDDMSNEAYQVMIRRPGPECRARLAAETAPDDRDALARALDGVTDDALPGLLSDLGGHDIQELERCLNAADADRTRPAVIFAYTIKGWRLPFAGDALNHSALMNDAQIRDLGPRLGADPDDPWAAFDPESPAGRLCRDRGRLLAPRRDRSERAAAAAAAIPIPDELPVRIPARQSTQVAFGDTLAALAREPGIGARIVTASPDVSVSTNLGGWINRVGVYSPHEERIIDDTPRPLTWAPRPTGQHVELGISEMNLFMWLSAFGLTAELLDEPLVPVGTVYDPFICRGLDALIYALYQQARFLLVATPSGVTLAPEGGAHQSSVTTLIGMGLPNLHAYEPTFAQETVWCVLEGIRGCLERDSGFASYLRLTTRPIDQALAEPVRSRLGEAEWRRQVLAGGYRLIDARDSETPLPSDAPVVHVAATGAVVPEAIQAVRYLHSEEVAANLLVITSPDRLAAELHDRRLSAVRDGHRDRLGHLATLLPTGQRRAPIVTVLDGASSTLAFLGGAFGAPTVPLGVDTFGQSGTIADLYRYTGIDAEHITDAALLALELGEAQS